MSKRIVAVFAGLVAVLFTFTGVQAQDDGESALTIGSEGGEDYASFYGDIIVPLRVDGPSSWLMNFRGSGDDGGAQELNLGLVYRHLFAPSDVIIGGNIYYDSRWTEADNQFNQLGFGVEVLTMWVDARFNYYLPEGGEELRDWYEQEIVTQTVKDVWDDPQASGTTITQDGYRRTTTTTDTYVYESYEHGREGYDAEIGFKLPISSDFGEYRIFGGYFNWESEYTTGEDEAERSDVKGFKGRIEARVAPVLFFDAIYLDDEELCGSEWILGARLRLPFDVASIAEGKNPFAGALGAKAGDFASRRFEMVMRDLKIRVEESDYKENTQKRKSEDVVTKKDLDYELKNVTFVDDDAANDPGPDDPTVSDPAEDGSAEHPYDEIQEGVDNANSPVVVFDGTYSENVWVNKDVDLIGSGHPFGGGKTLGNGPTTVNGWNGGANGPAMFVDGDSGANTVSVSGFDLLSSENGIYDPTTDIGLTALLAWNVMNFEFHHNTVRDTVAGVTVAYDDTLPNFNASIHDNVFYRLGAGIVAGAANGDGTIDIRMNLMDDAGLGILAGAIDMGGPRANLQVNIENNWIRGGGVGPVLGLASNYFGPIGFPSFGANLPSVGGIVLASYGRSDVSATIAGNVIEDNLLGITALGIGGNGYRARMFLDIYGNHVDGGGIGALLAGILPPLSPLDLSLAGISVAGLWDSRVIADIHDNTVMNHLLGMAAVAWDTDAVVEVQFNNNTLCDNLLGITGASVFDSRLKFQANNNVITGGGLDPLIPVDLGLSGILLLAVDGGDASDFQIMNNAISDELLGIGLVGLFDADLRGGEIANNNVDAFIGTLGLVYGSGAQLNRLNIHDNVFVSSGIPGLVDDLGVAGVLLLGLSDASITRVTIDNNVIDDHLLGIGLGGIGSVDMDNAQISNNKITDATIGILALSEGMDSTMRYLDIFGNTVLGANQIDPLVPGLFPADKGIAGIAVIGWNEANLRYGAIHDNTIGDMVLGIGAVGIDDARMRDWAIEDNVVVDPFVGIAVLAIDGTRMEMDITDNRIGMTSNPGYGAWTPPLLGGILPALPAVPGMPASPAPVGILAGGMSATVNSQFDIQGNVTKGMNVDIIGLSDGGEDFIFGGNSGDLAIIYSGLPGDLTDLGNPLPLFVIP